MGEHLPCKQGVDSSNLFISTTAAGFLQTEERITEKTLGRIYGLIAQMVRARA